MKTYVIKSWSAHTDAPDSEGNRVRITGRAGGLLSWLLNLLQISPTVSLAVRDDRIAFREGSLEGLVRSHVPLDNVCSTVYGYMKPWKGAIVIGTLVGLFAAFQFGVSGTVARILYFGVPGISAGILYYVLNTKLTIGFTDVGGHRYGICFKGSVMEGQTVDEEAAAKVCHIIQDLIARKTASRIAQASSHAAQTTAGRDRDLRSATFYYADSENQPKGPVVWEDLESLERSGAIKDDTRVIVEGGSTWSRWRSVKAQGER